MLCSDHFLSGRIMIGFVQAQVLRFLLGGHRSLDYDGLQGGVSHLAGRSGAASVIQLRTL